MDGHHALLNVPCDDGACPRRSTYRAAASGGCADHHTCDAAPRSPELTSAAIPCRLSSRRHRAARRNFPLPVVIGDGSFTAVTITLVLLAGLGVRGS